MLSITKSQDILEAVHQSFAFSNLLDLITVQRVNLEVAHTLHTLRAHTQCLASCLPSAFSTKVQILHLSTLTSPHLSLC